MIMTKFKKLFYSNTLVYVLILAFIFPGICYSYSDALRVPIGNMTRIDRALAEKKTTGQPAVPFNKEQMFTVNRQKEWFGDFVKITVNVLMAVEESIKLPANERKAQNERLRLKHSLNEKTGDLLDIIANTLIDKQYEDGKVGYVPGEGFSFIAIRKICSSIPEFYPEFSNVRAELDILYEVAAQNNVFIDNDFKKELTKLYEYTDEILEGSKDNFKIYSELSKDDVNMSCILLKWLGNIAELDSCPAEQSKAREFLAYFVKRTLIENKDILESYADFVFDIVKKAKNDFPMQGNEENIKVVTMLTGAEHLGYWLKLKSNQLGEKVVFKDLLLTVAMVMHLDYFLDTDTIFLTGESKNILKKYLYEKGILSNNTNHLIFIDTGFTGSINKFLNSMIRDMGIKEDFLLLGQHSSPYQEYLAKGLNKQENWKVSDERLNRLILLIDYGFEASISSPLKFTNGTDVKFLPTNKKWFYELVRKEIESLAKGELIFEDGLSDKLGNTTDQLLLQTSL